MATDPRTARPTRDDIRGTTTAAPAPVATASAAPAPVPTAAPAPAPTATATPAPAPAAAPAATPPAAAATATPAPAPTAVAAPAPKPTTAKVGEVEVPLLGEWTPTPEIVGDYRFSSMQVNPSKVPAKLWGMQGGKYVYTTGKGVGPAYNVQVYFLVDPNTGQVVGSGNFYGDGRGINDVFGNDAGSEALAFQGSPSYGARIYQSGLSAGNAQQQSNASDGTPNLAGGVASGTYYIDGLPVLRDAYGNYYTQGQNGSGDVYYGKNLPSNATTQAPQTAAPTPAPAAAAPASTPNIPGSPPPSPIPPGTQMGTGGQFQQAVSQATSTNEVPSTALAPNNTTSELLSQMQSLYADYGRYTQQLLELSQPSAEEKALSDQIRQFSTQMEQGIVHIEGQAIPTPLIGLQSQKLKENYAYKIKPLQDQLDSLVESRSARLDAITRVMQATPTMMAMLETMSKLSQPNVLGTQVNQQTGDVYAMVQNPDGTITTNKVGNVGASKTYQQTGTYQSADGSQYFWGLKPDGTIENIRLNGGAATQEKYVSSYTYQDQNGEQWFFGLKADGTSDNYKLQGQGASQVQSSQAYISEGSYQGADGKQYFYGVKPDGTVVSFPMSGPGNPASGGGTPAPSGGNTSTPSGNTSAPQGSGNGSILNNGSPAPNLNGQNYTSVKSPPNASLEPGMRSDQVKQLQEFLISQGYSIPDGATGYYGDQTKAAVLAWQKANGVDYGAYGGYWGPKSYAAYSSKGTGGTPAPASSSTGRTI